jgi:uncharacterized protein (TIGR02466 family)
MDLSYPIGGEVHIAFATPYLIREVPDSERLNEELIEIILNEKDKNSGKNISNIGGWHSNATLWDWKSLAIEQFKLWVHNSMLRLAALPDKETNLRKVDADYTAAAWANVNSHGDYNQSHIHPECDWSCVYYVSAGQPDPEPQLNGKFELRDPRTLALSSGLPRYGFGQSLIIDPEPGTMIMFPAWMEHLVHPFYGEGERISIATNIKMNS